MVFIEINSGVSLVVGNYKIPRRTMYLLRLSLLFERRGVVIC